jgi:hypothetical protein
VFESADELQTRRVMAAKADKPSEPDGPDSNGPVHTAGGGYPNVRRRAPTVRPARVILSAEQSALERDRLLAELGAVHSNDEAAGWAHRGLPSKNTLTVADAKLK